MVEQEDSEPTSPHEHIKATTTYNTVSENKLKQNRFSATTDIKKRLHQDTWIDPTPTLQTPHLQCSEPKSRRNIVTAEVPTEE